MTKKNTENWDNYWTGRASHQSGNALIEVGIERNHELKEFWTQIFSNNAKSSKVIDFACGAGSVLEHAHHIGFSDLTGLDVSEKALQVMTQKIVGAKSICAPVDKTGLEDNTYDLAVSQFGIEYAGNTENTYNALLEMYRILRPEGKMVVIAHMAGGVIAEGCQTSIRQIELIEQSQFIDTAKAVVTRLHNEDGTKAGHNIDSITQDLNSSAEPIMQWLRSFENIEEEKAKNEFTRFVYHLLESSHRLISQYHNYTLRDSLKWFDGIQNEIQAYKGRMLSMTGAALSREDISSFQNRAVAELGKNKIIFETPKVMKFGANTKPAAWIIEAQKF